MSKEAIEERGLIDDVIDCEEFEPGENDALFEPVTAVEAEFVRQYVVDLNAAKAYARALKEVKGNESKTPPYKMAWRMYHRPRVFKKIRKILTARNAVLEITETSVLEDIHRNYLMAIDKGDVAGANKAAELKGKTIAMFKDSTEHNVGASLTDLILKARQAE